MLKECYVEDKFINEREVSLKDMYEILDNFFKSNSFTKVSISIVCPSYQGVAYSVTNDINLNNVRLSVVDDNILIELEEFKNVVTINEDANVHLDLWNNRIRFVDSHMSWTFYK